MYNEPYIENKKESLYQQQALNLKIFENSNLLKFLSIRELEKKEIRDKILNCIQVFANYFQKIVMLRNIFTNNPVFSRMACAHLSEELGHDDILMKERGNKDISFDPILDSAMAWFCWKMMGLNDLEKTVLMHWVLETSAYYFFAKAKTIFECYEEMEYFKIHSEADEEHKNINPLFLDGLRLEEYASLETVLAQGWAIMTAACDRIVELVNLKNGIKDSPISLFKEI